jgi:hypothetical protein
MPGRRLLSRSKAEGRGAGADAAGFGATFALAEAEALACVADDWPTRKYTANIRNSPAPRMGSHVGVSGSPAASSLAGSGSKSSW